MAAHVGHAVGADALEHRQVVIEVAAAQHVGLRIYGLGNDFIRKISTSEHGIR